MDYEDSTKNIFLFFLSDIKCLSYKGVLEGKSKKAPLEGEKNGTSFP